MPLYTILDIGVTSHGQLTNQSNQISLVSFSTGGDNSDFIVERYASLNLFPAKVSLYIDEQTLKISFSRLK